MQDRLLLAYVLIGLLALLLAGCVTYFVRRQKRHRSDRQRWWDDFNNDSRG